MPFGCEDGLRCGFKKFTSLVDGGGGYVRFELAPRPAYGFRSQIHANYWRQGYGAGFARYAESTAEGTHAMNRRQFIGIVQATLLPTELVRATPGEQRILVGSTGSWELAAARGVARALRRLPESTSMRHVQWDAVDLQHADLRITGPLQGDRHWFDAAITIEREEEEGLRVLLERSAASFPIIRIVAEKQSNYVGSCVPSQVELPVRREGAICKIHVPRLWEAQLFRQFSMTPAQADGSRLLIDFNRMGESLDKIFERETQLMASILEAVLVTWKRILAGQPLGAHVSCDVDHRGLRSTRLVVA